MFFFSQKYIKQFSKILSKSFHKILTDKFYDSLYDEYREKIRLQTPHSPALSGFKVYCQNDEDGIIEDIMQRIGIKESKFIEIGCGDGIENNTHFLALKGWSGVWIDGTPQNIQSIKDATSGRPFDPQKVVNILVKQIFVTKNNIVSKLEDCLDVCDWKFDQVEFLSIDVDGNDIFLAEKIFEKYRPTVVCIEYNSIFPPSCKFTPTYDEKFTWEQDDYMGSSLRSLCESFEKFDYFLACCNLSGVNAFFVKNSCRKSFANYTIQELYMPARYNFLRAWEVRYGHKRSLKNLANIANFLE